MRLPARKRPRSPWRPIFTAPKDEQILLLYPGHDQRPFVCQGRWVDVPHTNELDGWLQSKAINEISGTPKPRPTGRPGWQAGYVAIACSSMGSTLDARSYHGTSFVVFPTHWQPLPRPPARLPRGYSPHG